MVQTVNFPQAGVQPQVGHPIKFDAALTAVGAAGAAVSVTIPASSTRPNILGQIHYSYSMVASLTGFIQVEDGSGSIVWGPHAITATGHGVIDFTPPLAESSLLPIRRIMIGKLPTESFNPNSCKFLAPTRSSFPRFASAWRTSRYWPWSLPSNMEPNWGEKLKRSRPRPSSTLSVWNIQEMSETSTKE